MTTGAISGALREGGICHHCHQLDAEGEIYSLAQVLTGLVGNTWLVLLTT